MMSVNNPLASHPQADTKGLTLRCDNGSRYRSGAFRESMRALRIRVEFIYANTPEQIEHVESFHSHRYECQNCYRIFSTSSGP